jgi:hypothetical protein
MFEAEMRNGSTYHRKNMYRNWIVVSFIFLLFNSCTKNLTVSTVLYDNNFDNGDTREIAIGGWQNGNFGPLKENRLIRFAGSTMIGPLNNNTLILILSSLPSHSIARVEADIYLHNNWKNELWNMRFDGNVVLTTGFSNDKTVQQSYPDILGGVSPGPAGRDALDIQLPGICNQASAVANIFPNPSGTTHYKIVQTVPHTARSLELVMGDSGGTFNDTCSRSWSIDNLKVTVFKN